MDCFFSLLFSFLLVSAVLSVPSPAKPSLTHKDYVYNGHMDAFYKLHTAPAHLTRAEEACKAEGAELMIPATEEDKFQAAALMKEHDIGDLVWIGNDNSSGQFNGEYCPQAISRDRKITAIKCSGLLAFVCKVTAAKVTAAAMAATAAEVCEPYGYRYYPETGSCYRVPPQAAVWEDAAEYCREENAHLLVLNSKQESKTIKAFLETIPPVLNAKSHTSFCSGLKADMPSREFRTIFGENVDHGFWSLGEPDNAEEYCGSTLVTTGKYNDIPCHVQYGFICEKEVSSWR